MKKLLSLVLTFSVMMSTVHAETDNAASWYLGAGAGVSRLNPDTKNSEFSVSDKYDFAFKAYAGYDWSERISAEAYYTDLGKAGISPYGEVDYRDFGISGLYYFRERPDYRYGWALFGKLGVGRMKNDSDLRYKRNHDYHVLFGIGTEHKITTHLTLRFELELFEEDAQLLSFNLMRRFDSGR